MQDKISSLQKKAQWVRKNIFEMIVTAGKGHIGGAFSCTDILVALYYGGILRFDPSNNKWDKRDRFILSKGHSCEALYVILADLGFFPFDELENYQKGGGLGGHPDRGISGIEADTGSLGHGLGIGAGLALSAKMDNKDFLTITLLGDGECCEGSVWEAAMFAAKHNLNNLVGIVDNNGLCSTDFLEECTAIAPLDEKWKAFGWDTIVINGHLFKDLIFVFAKIHTRKSSKPLMIIAKTIKGKGVSFMENNPAWHHGVPKGDIIEKARREFNLV